MSAKNARLLMLALLYALFLSSCIPNGAYDVTINCFGEGEEKECEILVENLTGLEKTIRLLVDIEEPGKQITENFWGYELRDFKTLVNFGGTLDPGGTQRFITSVNTNEGLSLLRVTMDTWSHSPMIRFFIIGEPLTDQPIQHEVSCSGGKLSVTTSIASGLGDQEFTVYFDEELNDPNQTFLVEDGGSTHVETHLPEGLLLIEVDLLYHQDVYAASVDLNEAHRFRAYCIPEK